MPDQPPARAADGGADKTRPQADADLATRHPNASSGGEERPRVGRLDHILGRWRRTKGVIRAPRVKIEIYGGEESLEVYRAFTARHRRFKFTSAKRWGVALLRLPGSGDSYLASVARLARRRRRNALAVGYRYVLVSPMAHIDEILEINKSSESRQGRQMESAYLDRARLVSILGGRTTIHGILDTRGRLRAYADVLDIGGAYTFSYLIGHADDLDQGIMYLLVGEVVRSCIDARRVDGSPTWLMVDTFWGASAGLAFFKERTGFRPFTVDWVWVDRRL